jgi:hypothetical protein
MALGHKSKAFAWRKDISRKRSHGVKTIANGKTRVGCQPGLGEREAKAIEAQIAANSTSLERSHGVKTTAIRDVVKDNSNSNYLLFIFFTSTSCRALLHPLLV